MTKSSNGTEKTIDAAHLERPRGWSGERGGYLGAITTEKLPRLPKAPPLVSGETTLANAMPSTNGAKNDQG